MGPGDSTLRPVDPNGDYDHRRQRVLRYGAVALAVLIVVILVGALI